jgi:hypothetical protein
VFLFKSFPISVVMRHWSRAMGMPSAGGRAAYVSTFIASTTYSARCQQLNDMASGRNPRDMVGKDAGKFWLGALLKGGGLGLYGDFLYPIIPAMVVALWHQCLARSLVWLMMWLNWGREYHSMP